MSDNSNQFSFGGSPPRALAAEEASQPEGSDDMYSAEDLGELSGAIVYVEEETVSIASTPPQDGGADQQQQKAVEGNAAHVHDSDAVPRRTEPLGSRGACSEVFPGVRQAGGRQGPSTSGASGLGAANGEGSSRTPAAPGCEPGKAVEGANAEGLGAVDSEELAPRPSKAPGLKVLAPAVSPEGSPEGDAINPGPSRRLAGGETKRGDEVDAGRSSRQKQRSASQRSRQSTPPTFGPTRASRPHRSSSNGSRRAELYYIGDEDDSVRSATVGSITPRSITPRGPRGRVGSGSRSRSPTERADNPIQIRDWIMPG